MRQPAERPRTRQGNGDDDQDGRETHKHEYNLPPKKPKTGPPAPSPARADVALPRYDAVEQNESHHAADVSEKHQQDKTDHDHSQHHSRKQGRVICQVRSPVRPQKSLLRCRVLSIRWETLIEMAASARTQLARQKSHQSESRPLAEAERAKELLLGVLKSRIDCIRG